MNIENRYTNFSKIQISILESELIYPNLLINNISVLLIYDFIMDLNILSASLNYIVENNETLRYRIEYKNNTYNLVVKEFLYENYELLNIKDKTELNKSFNIFGTNKINVLDNKLFDFKIIFFNENKTAIFIKFHHIIADSWSCFNFEKQLYNIYLHLLENNKYNNFNFVQYSKFIDFENKYFNSKKLIEDNNFWSNKLLNLEANSYLEKKFPNQNNYSSQRLQLKLSQKETIFFYNICKKLKVSPLLFSISVFSILVQKIVNYNKLIFFIPIHNRRNDELKKSLGVFVNTLPFVIDINPDLTFIDFLKKLQKDYLDLLKHSTYPNYLIYKDLNFKSLDSIFISFEGKQVNDHKIYTTHFFGNDEISSLAIHISDRDFSEQIIIDIDYKDAFYKEKFVRNLFHYQKNLVKNLLINKNSAIKNIEIISYFHKSKILNIFNKPIKKYKFQKTLVDYLIEISYQYKHKNIIHFNGFSFTYDFVNTNSNIIANFLISNYNLNDNYRIGVISERSEKMIILYFAVLKAGCIIVPIDVNIPQKRKELMLEISNVNLVITTNLEQLDINSDIILYDKLFENKKESIINFSKTEKNAVINFTSGTQGIPKCVITKHSSYINLLNSWNDIYKLKKREIILLQLASFSFDVFIGDLLKVIPRAGTIILTNENQRISSKDLVELIKNYKVSIFESTPAILMPLMNYIINNNINIEQKMFVISGGEAICNKEFYKFVNYFENRISFFNSYGVTESTIETTSYLAKTTDNYNIINAPLGFPLENNHIYILNDSQNFIPETIEGDLYISGENVAEKYLNDNKLSEIKFLKNPFVEGLLMYKTGDKAAWTDEGNIEFFGRTDTQLKINGIRVETSEIEFYIKKFPKIKNTIVIAQKANNNTKLIAFICSDEKINTDNLIHFLKKYIHNSLIPNQFFFIEKIPLTTNGKINYVTLNEIIVEKRVINYISPKNKKEIIIEKIICKILNIKHLSINSNFFDNGLTSIDVMRSINEFEKYNLILNPQDLYNFPTIELLGKFIERKQIKKLNTNKNNLDFLPWSKIEKFDLSKKNYNKIILTGATGLLGCHILFELTKQFNYEIFCLIRAESVVSAKTKLEEKYKYYFSSELPNNITVTNISKLDIYFGLNFFSLKNIKIDAIIHSAANTKHIGKYDELEYDNVLFTNKLIEFSIKNNSDLHHISTLSVLNNKNEFVFTENNIFEPDDIELNPYIKTKYIAEKNIVNQTNSLNFTIYRVGNLTGRYSDGFFAKDFILNSTYSKLIYFFNNNKLLKNYNNLKIELTPVDECAQAIINLLDLNISNKKIYHLFNENKIELSTITEILSKNEFNFNKPNFVFNFDNINYKQLNYSNEITNKILKETNFFWNIINEKYLEKIITFILKNNE